ncbi:MAG TPA: DNA/RNA non-specific endonuclease [Candidatus Coprenecus pullicola]|nr:DNA/RNA non-specific endonuclease [Candidatus Coprenecus pullicola]
MFHKHKVLRIVILLAVMLPAVLLSSCTEDEGREVMGEKAVRLSRDTVAYDHTGQFVTIESSVDWSISLSYDGTQDGWAKVSPESGSGSVNNVMLTYSANEDRQDREVSLNVAFSDGELIAVTLVQKGDPDASGGDGPGLDPDPGPDIEGLVTATVEEFLAAEPDDTVWYKLTGYITDIEDGTYGNLTIEDGTGQVYIYGLTAEGPLEGNDQSFSSLGLKEGDVLTLATVRGEYQGEPQGGGKETPAYYISHEQGEDPDPDDPWPGLKSDPYQSGWMELPAVEDEEGRAFIYHTAEVDGQQKRNYSMLYDAAGRIALWVAYPLCGDYIGSGRTDAWGYDPKIPDEYEPLLNHGWPERGFDRGHQIPSGSRNANTAMNRQTFYYTNMTAQVSGFNQKIWANLENRVRGFASVCDTLYVVTGPIFDSGEPERWTEDNAGNPVAVPDGYFKAVLSYSVSSSAYYSVAFVYDNTEYSRSNPTASDMCSVSEVEEMTGFTFFNNLPRSIASSVKAQCEPDRWGL